MPEEQTILVIGACVLDRLLTVKTFPAPDSKVRTTSIDESGGGNAANTAMGMARLLDASFLSRRPRIKLISKVGDDAIGMDLLKSLAASGVDVESVTQPVDTTTSLTTVIVSELEHTRTCLHTPGTCGELSSEDIWQMGLNHLIDETVIHVHTDGRHTDAALALVKEAVCQGIGLSVDVEKDRNSKALDELLKLATLVFTNSNQMKEYLERLTLEYETAEQRRPLPLPNITAKGLKEMDVSFYAQAIQPSSFFTRWFSQEGKEVVITHGDRGSAHIHCETFCVDADKRKSNQCSQVHDIRIEFDSLRDTANCKVYVNRLEEGSGNSPSGMTDVHSYLEKYSVLAVGILKRASYRYNWCR
jgi:sugar/nucleoside kinase (ribokinase family)